MQDKLHPTDNLVHVVIISKCKINATVIFIQNLFRYFILLETFPHDALLRL